MPVVLQNIKKAIPNLGTLEAQNRIKEAFGSEEAKAGLLSLLDVSAELPGNIAGIADAFNRGARTTIDAARKVDDNVAGSFSRLKNQFMNLTEAVGNGQSVWAKPLADAGGRVLLAAQEFTKAHPVLVGTPVAMASGLAGVVFAAGAVRFAMGGLLYSFTALRIGASAASARVVASLIAIKAAAVQANIAMQFSGIRTGAKIPKVSFAESGLLGGMTQFAAQGGIGAMARIGYQYANVASRSFLARLAGVAPMVAGAMGISGTAATATATTGALAGVAAEAATASVATTGLFAGMSAGATTAAAAFWPIVAAVAIVAGSIYVLWYGFKGYLAGLADAIRPVVKPIYESLVPAISEIRKSLSEIMSYFGGAFGEAGLGGLIAHVGRRLAALAVTPLIPFVRAFGYGLWVALKSIALILEAIAAMTRGITYAFRAVSQWIDAGKAIVTGIVSGIEGVGWMITEAIASFVPGGKKLLNYLFPKEVTAAESAKTAMEGVSKKETATDKPIPAAPKWIGQPLQYAGRAAAVASIAMTPTFHPAVPPRLSPVAMQAPAVNMAQPETIKMQPPAMMMAMAPAVNVAPPEAITMQPPTMTVAMGPSLPFPQSQATPYESVPNARPRLEFRPAPVSQQPRPAAPPAVAPQRDTEVAGLLRELLAELRSAHRTAAGMATRPINLKSVIDGRTVAAAVAKHDRISSVRAGQ